MSIIIEMICSVNDIELDNKLLKKMMFLYNAIEQGWNIKKKGNVYIFIKKHGGDRKYFDDNYLSTFMEESTNIESIVKELL